MRGYGYFTDIGSSDLTDSWKIHQLYHPYAVPEFNKQPVSGYPTPRKRLIELSFTHNYIGDVDKEKLHHIAGKSV